jgi:hypothetical protein
MGTEHHSHCLLADPEMHLSMNLSARHGSADGLLKAAILQHGCVRREQPSEPIGCLVGVD